MISFNYMYFGSHEVISSLIVNIRKRTLYTYVITIWYISILCFIGEKKQSDKNTLMESCIALLFCISMCVLTLKSPIILVKHTLYLYLFYFVIFPAVHYVNRCDIHMGTFPFESSDHVYQFRTCK